MATEEEEKQKQALLNAGRILFEGATFSKIFRSSYTIILMNLFPVLAVFLFNWQVKAIVYFYVAETIIVGLINVLKMMAAQGTDTDKNGNTTRLGIPAKLGLVAFFLFHYFFFIFVQMQFIVMAVSSDSEGFSGFFAYFAGHKDALFGLMIVFTTHLVSFFTDYIGHGTYKNMGPMVQMFIPYGRIFVQQIIGIVGGIVVLAFGSPVALLVLLQVMKTVVDVLAHYITVNKYKEISRIAAETE